MEQNDLSLEIDRNKVYQVKTAGIVELKITNEINKEITNIDVSATCSLSKKTCFSRRIRRLRPNTTLVSRIQIYPTYKGIVLFDLKLCFDMEDERNVCAGECQFLVFPEPNEVDSHVEIKDLIRDVNKFGFGIEQFKIQIDASQPLAQQRLAVKKIYRELADSEPHWTAVQLDEESVIASPAKEPSQRASSRIAKRIITEVPGQNVISDTAILTCQEPQREFFLFGKSRLTLGRRGSNDIPLCFLPKDVHKERSLKISRSHAQLEYKDNKFFVRDWDLDKQCGSTNGVYVNGRRISVRQYVSLSDGDTLSISREFQLRISLFESIGLYQMPFLDPTGSLITPQAGLLAARLRRVSNAPNIEYILLLRKVTLGSGEDNCLIIPGLSSCQAVLYYYQDQFWIEPLTNGVVFMEDLSLSSGCIYLLKNSINLTLGSIQCTFQKK